MANDNTALVELVSAHIHWSNNDLKPAASVVRGNMFALETNGKVGRVSVVNVVDETAEVFDIDTGVETICHQSELLELPAEALTCPPSVMTVRLVTEDVLHPGQSVTGTLRASQANHELELIV